MRKILTVAMASLLVLAVQAAWGATRSDPNDVTGGLDIKTSSVREAEIADGVFRTRFAVTTYDQFDLSDGVGSFYWQLDTKGDGAADYELYMFGDPKAVPAGPLFCLLKASDHSGNVYGRVKQGDASFLCGFPSRFVKTTHDVRWRLAGRMEGTIDRAPDSGWYSA